jgi:hypothetical protein
MKKAFYWLASNPELSAQVTLQLIEKYNIDCGFGWSTNRNGILQTIKPYNNRYIGIVLDTDRKDATHGDESCYKDYIRMTLGEVVDTYLQTKTPESITIPNFGGDITVTKDYIEVGSQKIPTTKLKELNEAVARLSV